ncbi:MAG: hypothetical protein GY778_16920 [bacterium]|nr:hypothetical protein [bacterium]
MRMTGQRARFLIGMAVCGLGVLAGGCSYSRGAGGSVARSATLVRTVESTMADYHREIERSADADERRVIAGFVAMMRRDGIDERASRAHAAGFEAAMARIRAYRRGEQVRYSAAQRSVDDLRAAVAEWRQRSGDVGRLGAVLSRVAGNWVTGGGLEAVGALSEAATGGMGPDDIARSGE